MKRLTERQKEFLKALVKAGGESAVWKIEIPERLLPLSACRSQYYEGAFKLRIANQLAEKGLVKLEAGAGERGGWIAKITDRGKEVVQSF